MTTVFISDKDCFVCGATSKYPVSNYAVGNVGPRDLDGRPAQILRSSVYLWIQRCPSCGYCAPEIAKGDEIDSAVLQSEAYRTQLYNAEFTETANAFLCHSLIMRHRGLPADAAWAAVFAAWICDDNNYPESALFCRRTALTLFLAARDLSIDFADSKEQEAVYLIDLYRRCGNFAASLALCDEEIGKQHSDAILDVLCFEKDLIEKSDSAIHSTAQVDDGN
jgi:hypothetical protein